MQAPVTSAGERSGVPRQAARLSSLPLVGTRRRRRRAATAHRAANPAARRRPSSRPRATRPARRHRARTETKSHCRSRLRGRGRGVAPVHGVHGATSPARWHAEAHGVVRTLRTDRRGDDSNSGAHDGRRARPARRPSPSGVSSSYPGLPPLQPARPKSALPRPNWRISSNTPEQRDPASIGHYGRRRDSSAFWQRTSLDRKSVGPSRHRVLGGHAGGVGARGRGRAGDRSAAYDRSGPG